MKRREIQRLVQQYLAPSFPELELTGDLLARWDGDPIARGFVFDRHAGFVRLEAWAQPLFVPADDVSLGIAQTLGDFWLDGDADESTVAAEMLQRAESVGRAFLDRVSDCSSLAQTVLEMPGDRMDPSHAAQVSGYCLIWLGRAEEAAHQLDHAIEELHPIEAEWDLELLGEIKLVCETLERSEDEARALLDARARETARALKLV